MKINLHRERLLLVRTSRPVAWPTAISRGWNKTQRQALSKACPACKAEKWEACK